MRSYQRTRQMLARGDLIVNKSGWPDGRWAPTRLRSPVTGRVRYGGVAINLVGFAMMFINVRSFELRFGGRAAFPRMSFAHGDFSFPAIPPDTENSHF
jgi:hypothetical protein